MHAMKELNVSRFADYKPDDKEKATVARRFSGEVDKLLTNHRDYTLTTFDGKTGKTLEVIDLVNRTENNIVMFSAGRTSRGDSPQERHLIAHAGSGEQREASDMPPGHVYFQNVTQEQAVRRLDMR